jgi:hypothetical protein
MTLALRRPAGSSGDTASSPTATGTTSPTSAAARGRGRGGGGGVLSNYFVLILLLFGVLTLIVNNRFSHHVTTTSAGSLLESALENSVNKASKKSKSYAIKAIAKSIRKAAAVADVVKKEEDDDADEEEEEESSNEEEEAEKEEDDEEEEESSNEDEEEEAEEEGDDDTPNEKEENEEEDDDDEEEEEEETDKDDQKKVAKKVVKKVATTTTKANMLAGLNCDKYGGPSPELAQEMVYWEDIPADTQWTSPFKKTGDNNIQYLTFEPDHGGWNNIRMAMETVLATAFAMGRTLVLPPDYKMYLLSKAKGDQRKHFSFNHFFHMESIADEHVGLDIITSEYTIYCIRVYEYTSSVCNC